MRSAEQLRHGGGVGAAGNYKERRTSLLELSTDI